MEIMKEAIVAEAVVEEEVSRREFDVIILWFVFSLNCKYVLFQEDEVEAVDAAVVTEVVMGMERRMEVIVWPSAVLLLVCSVMLGKGGSLL